MIWKNPEGREASLINTWPGGNVPFCAPFSNNIHSLSVKTEDTYAIKSKKNQESEGEGRRREVRRGKRGRKGGYTLVLRRLLQFSELVCAGSRARGGDILLVHNSFRKSNCFLLDFF